MKKIGCILLLLSVFGVGTAYSGFDYKRLEGEWNVVKIIDAETGVDIKGIHGPQNSYLKFTFVRKKLFISRAPFDRGFENDIYVKNDVIKRFEEHIEPKRWESAYEIEKLTKNEMVLQTVTRPGKKIKYLLKKIVDIHSEDEKIVFDPIFFVTFFNKEGEQEGSLKSYSFDRNTFHFKTPTKDGWSFLGGLKYGIVMPEVENKNKIMGLDVIVEVVLDNSGEVVKFKKLDGDNSEFADSIIKYMADLKWNVGYASEGDVHMEFHFKYLRLPSEDMDLINQMDENKEDESKEEDSSN